MNKDIINEDEWQKHDNEMKKKLIARIKLRETLLITDEYIQWLEEFTQKYPNFTDNDWLYQKEKLKEEDSFNVEKLILFFERIENYADNNYIYPTKNNNHTSSYNIKHNNIGYNIGIIYGQGGMCFCDRIEAKENFIDYYNIKNNVELNNTKVIKENLESLKLYINSLLEKNIPVEVLREATEKILRKK